MKLSDIQVTYLDHMGSDLTVVNAARVSFDKQSDWDRSKHLEFVNNGKPYDLKLTEKDQKLVHYLAKHNHWSPFAHASASFRVKAPIFVARQLVKHTVGFSWNEVSRRYVDDEPEFYIPKTWRKRAENVKQGSSEEAADSRDTALSTRWTVEGVNHHITELALYSYQQLLSDGVCPEQARMVLPQNTMTEWIWTGTLYAWARMCNLRLDSHTQKETQKVAERIHESMKELFPVSWEALKQV
jgi:thymidylate synthase (FAD)